MSLAIGFLGLLAMGLHVPVLRVKRIYVVVPVRQAGSPIVSMGQSNELREIRTEAAGYAWVWSRLQETTWFGTEVEFQLNWTRLGLQAAVWWLILLTVMAIIERLDKGCRKEIPTEPLDGPANLNKTAGRDPRC